MASGQCVQVFLWQMAKPVWHLAKSQSQLEGHLPLLLLMPMGMTPQHCVEESPLRLQRKHPWQPLVTPP